MAIIDYSKTRFEVGQKVALRFQNNKARYNEEKENGYILMEITKIGRKYLTVGKNLQIDITTGYNKTQYSPDYQLFPSEKELLEQLEREMNIKEVQSHFTYKNTNLTNEQLKRIMEIIKE